MNVFPDITDTKILPFKLISGILLDDPNALDRADCPYSSNVKVFLKSLFVKRDEQKASEMNPTNLSELALETIEGEGYEELENIDLKLKTLIATLDKVQKNLKISETNEQIQVAKAQAQLLDRLLAMRERVLNMKNMAFYTETVLELIEEHLSPDQRTSIINRLKDFNSGN